MSKKAKQKQEYSISVYDRNMNKLSPTNLHVATVLILRERARWIKEDESIMLLKNKKDFKELKNKVIQIEKRVCYICQITIPENVYATVDHIEPKSKYGKDSIENLRCCCKKCNDDKANRSFGEYYEHILANERNYSHLDFSYLFELNNNKGRRVEYEICASS